MSDKKFEALS